MPASGTKPSGYSRKVIEAVRFVRSKAVRNLRQRSRFLGLNVVPRRVIAEFGINEVLHVRLDIAGLTEQCLSIIAVKVGQIPSLENAGSDFALM